MYLSGAMTFRFPDGHTEVLNPGAPMTWLADFLKRQGAAVRPDGSVMLRSQILGGELFDGCPSNVILADGQWLPEQLDAIRSNPQVRAALDNCRYLPSEFRSAPPVALQANNAPTAGSTVDTLTRAAGQGSGAAAAITPYTPTGVATPTVIMLPGGGSYVEPAGTAAPAASMPESAGFDLLPLALLGGAALWFFSGKKKRGGK